MIKKKMALLLAAVMLILCCSGCAENQIPNMTDEEMRQIGEYVGITLMKYDAVHRSRLVEIEDEPILPETTPEPTPEPEGNGGMDPVEETPVVDRTEGNGAEVNSLTVEEVLKFDEGLRLVFKGQEICEYYPKDGPDAYFSISASEGKKLLILNFSLSNTSDKDVKVDILSTDIKFRIAVNGEYTRRALTTMLENDLSTYVENLSAGENKDVVLIIEVTDENANEISSVELKVQNESATCTIKVL